MDQFSLGLMLWLGLTQVAPAPPKYEMNHFYYHDRQGWSQPLPLQNKLWLPATDATKKYISDNKLTHEKLKEPHKEGYVVSFRTRLTTLEAMSELSKNNLPYLPIVQWEGMEVVPTYKIIVQVHPFVTEAILNKRLTDLRSFKVVSVEHVEGFIYNIEVENPILPPNILAVANMLAEDSAWFTWARVLFEPVRFPASGVMAVTQGHTDLGYKRTLDLTISVYKPSIKIRKDLLPKLGQNSFAPAPHKGDVWYDFDAPTITEDVTPERTLIKISFPFRFLHYGNIQIPPVQIAYEDGKKQGTFWVSGISYKNASVIQGTDLEDLQAINWNLQFQPLPELPDVQPQFLPLTKIGGGVLAGGFLMFLLGVTVLGLRGLAAKSPQRVEAARKRGVRNELYYVARKLPKAHHDRWRQAYLEAEEKLQAVLREFFGHPLPIASDDPNVATPTIRMALAELEKLYKPNPHPDARALAGHLLKVYEECDV
jgi:hypothetical protein